MKYLKIGVLIANAVYGISMDASSKFRFPFEIKVVAAGTQPGLDVPADLVGKTITIIGLHWGAILKSDPHSCRPVDCIYRYTCKSVQGGVSIRYIHESSLDILPESAFVQKRAKLNDDISDEEDDTESEARKGSSSGSSSSSSESEEVNAKQYVKQSSPLKTPSPNLRSLVAVKQRSVISPSRNISPFKPLPFEPITQDTKEVEAAPVLKSSDKESSESSRSSSISRSYLTQPTTMG